jgi:hypothetical protein
LTAKQATIQHGNHGQHPTDHRIRKPARLRGPLGSHSLVAMMKPKGQLTLWKGVKPPAPPATVAAPPAPAASGGAKWWGCGITAPREVTSQCGC